MDHIVRLDGRQEAALQAVADKFVAMGGIAEAAQARKALGLPAI